MSRGLIASGAAFFLLTVFREPAWARSSGPLEAYLAKIFLAVAVMGGLGFLLVRWGPRFRKASYSGLEVLTSLSLGRGVLYVVRFGPQILLVGESKNGYQVLGRCPADGWEDNFHEEPSNGDPD